MKDVVSRIIADVERHRLWNRGDCVGVAVSGGFDSVALLELLAELAPRWDLRLTVLHANHSLRGEESDGDEAFVRQLAGAKGLEIRVERLPCPASRSNLEEQLRRLRYSFFAEARRSLGLARIAVAHTIEDQGETVFLHLTRGAGTTGLAGIAPVNDAGIVRPLLGVSRVDLWEFLKERGVDWREDSSNRDLRIARNRFRSEMLPALRTWNPRVLEALARTAEIARGEEEFWDAEVARHFEGTWQPHRLGLIGDTGSLARVPLALRRRLLRGAIEKVGGGLEAVGFEHIEEALRLTEASEGSGAVSLPGLAVERSFDRILVRGAVQREEFAARAVAAGEAVEVPGGYLEVRLVRGDRECGYTEGGVAGDRDLAVGPLEVRGWRPGDGYRPAGFTGRRKLKELFQIARVPSWDRESWPIITRGGEIVWTRRFGFAAEYAAGADSGEVMLISEYSGPEKGTLTPRPSV